MSAGARSWHGGAVASALALDRLIGEPPDRWHPVVWFGTLMTKLEQRTWADDRRSGIVYTISGFALGVAAGLVLRSATVALTVAGAGRALEQAARDVAEHLERDDLTAARASLPTLVGRDPTELDESGIAAAVIESLAENTVDAVIAPAFWTLACGAPGALAYRAVNTMDAMVGHRSERYGQFGWASARLDDAANWIPARLFALLVMASTPSRARLIAGTVRRDASAHPSPNGGVAECAVAAAIGVELGGPLRYGDREENRPRLGAGWPRPGSPDISGAITVVTRAQVLLGALAVVVAARRRVGLKR